MLPHLAALDGVVRQGPTPTLVPPPRFRPLLGPTWDLRLQARRNYVMALGDTAAQKSGLRYEREVQNFLLKKFQTYYKPSPYIHFVDAGIQRTCQPDGILLQDEFIYVFEIKYQHMPEAWWQLERLYAPLLRLLFPRHQVCCVEICRSYDPAMPFPCEVSLIDDLDKWIERPRKEFGVFKCRTF